MWKYSKRAIALLLATVAAFLLWHRQSPTTLLIDSKKALLSKNIVPLAVIGSGPAGLSAALYGARAGVHTVVFEGKTPGGQLTTTTYVENWPGTPKMLGSQLIAQNKKQAETFGALLVPDSITSVDFSSWPYTLKTEEGHEVHALAVILATGANPRLLSDTRPVKGEKEYFGYGVTTCAICDAPFYKGKKVIVVGGGDSAIEEATLLTSYAQSVILLVRGEKMRAAQSMQARLKDSPKITVRYTTEITEIQGDGTKVTGVKLLNTKTKATEELPIDGVFLAIGHKPNTAIVAPYLSLDPEGYIILPTRSQKTSLPGVFAAGDVSDHTYRQAGVAAGDGIKAALDALAFLQEHGYNENFAKELEKNYFEPQPETPLTLTKLNSVKEFEKLSKAHEFLVVEVGADYCASCKALVPIVQSVAARIEKAHFAQIDIGADPKDLIARFELKAIPAILIFKKGKLIARYDQQIFTKRELFSIINQLVTS